LPAPLGPSSPKNSPRRTSSETASTARRSPYRLVTSRTVTAGGGPSAGTGWVGVMCGTSFVGCAVQGGRTGSGDGRRGAPVRGRRTRDRRLRGRRVRGSSPAGSSHHQQGDGGDASGHREQHQRHGRHGVRGVDAAGPRRIGGDRVPAAPPQLQVGGRLRGEVGGAQGVRSEERRGGKSVERGGSRVV